MGEWTSLRANARRYFVFSHCDQMYDNVYNYIYTYVRLYDVQCTYNVRASVYACERRTMYDVHSHTSNIVRRAMYISTHTKVQCTSVWLDMYLWMDLRTFLQIVVCELVCQIFSKSSRVRLYVSFMYGVHFTAYTSTEYILRRIFVSNVCERSRSRKRGSYCQPIWPNR